MIVFCWTFCPCVPTYVQTRVWWCRCQLSIIWYLYKLCILFIHYFLIGNWNNFKKYYERENWRFKKSSYNIYSYTCHHYKYIGGQNTTNTHKKLWFSFVSIKSMWIIFQKWWNTLWMLLRQKTLSTIIYRVMLHLFKFQ